MSPKTIARATRARHRVEMPMVHDICDLQTSEGRVRLVVSAVFPPHLIPAKQSKAHLAHERRRLKRHIGALAGQVVRRSPNLTFARHRRMYKCTPKTPSGVAGDPRRESPRTGANFAGAQGRKRIEQLQARARQLTSQACGGLPCCCRAQRWRFCHRISSINRSSPSPNLADAVRHRRVASLASRLA